MTERIAVYDIEADGLLDTATSVHCIVLKEVGSSIIHKFWDSNKVLHRLDADGEYHHHLTSSDILGVFKDYSKLICHNQISYDIPMINKFYGIDIYDMFGEENIIDTFVWSQVLNPDRLLPKGCPTTIIPSKELRERGYKSKKIGPHGLDSWGYRVGRKKPAIHDWTTFTPGILGRCVEDVLINEATYSELCKEGKL